MEQEIQINLTVTVDRPQMISDQALREVLLEAFQDESVLGYCEEQDIEIIQMELSPDQE